MWQSGVLKPLYMSCIPYQVVFHRRLSLIKSCLSSKIPSIKVCLKLKGHLSFKDVFHSRVSYIKGHLSPNIVINLSSSGLGWCKTIVYQLRPYKTIHTHARPHRKVLDYSRAYKTAQPRSTDLSVFEWASQSVSEWIIKIQKLKSILIFLGFL